MPDPMAPAIAYFYCEDDNTMEYLVGFLIRSGEWFDVRRTTKHKWSICFNTIADPPKSVKSKLIAMEPQETEIQRNVADYKAKKAAKDQKAKPKGR